MKKNLLLSAFLLLPFLTVWTQSNRTNTIPLIGVEAPSFTAESTNGRINFPGDFNSSWKILFAHPKNFTPVCSSELLELALNQDNFKSLDAKIVVISTDNMSQHNSWKAALEEISYKGNGPVKIDFPLIDDNNFRVSNLYGMIHSAASIGQNIRGVFIIDPENKVRSIHYYPNEVGRNIDELLRTLAALQATDKDKNVVTPANWEPGNDFMVPVISAEERESIGVTDSPFYQKSWFMTYKKNNQ